jgi:outer membrane protein assembly factor BamE
MRASVCIGILALALAGCQSFSIENLTSFNLASVGVYKLDINQGNYITSDQVERLKVGQTRQQVRQVLGTPLLADPFHAERWDYIYQFQRQGQVLEHTQLSVFFVNDRVARWENGELPPPPTEVARAGGGDAMLDKSLSIAPKTGETNWLVELLRKLGWWE